eukprot:2871325-Rhodomonas_salina.1
MADNLRRRRHYLLGLPPPGNPPGADHRRFRAGASSRSAILVSSLGLVPCCARSGRVVCFL